MTASLSHPRAAQRSLHAMPSSSAASLRTPALRLVPQPEGLLQVHTAPFRGSVASVLSQALRSAGLGSRVLISQFLKGGVDQGPDQIPTLCGRLQWLRPDLPVCIDAPLTAAMAADGDGPLQRQAIVEVWELCRAQLLAASVDLMVLDELGLAISYGYLGLDDVVATLQQRPAQMDVILTGPSIPEPLMAMADQVTQLRRGL
ncbi:MAG: ATP--corrinoid adenosyltransferase [Cyanobacteria bacterium K_DeepCast_35m_m2_023]|nr:ATP--corrinoid adenosyltransferase [Cyanobacteria bacterium K_DeepCast_35m_m2_023]